MIDLFDYSSINSNHQAFFTNGITESWQVWTKPKGVSYVYITCIGSGGGGGSAANVGGSNSGGGGGGGASSVTKILLPANVIPDLLYIQVGAGGIGGTASSENAVDGSLSYVSISPSTISSRVIIASGTVPAGRGLRGTTLVGGSGGSAGTVFTSAVGILSELGIWQSVAGRVGSQGGFGSTLAQNVTGVGGGTFVTGGAGGAGLGSGGADFQGGTILATGAVLNFNVAGGAAGGGQGRGGYTSSRPKDLTYASRKFPQILTGGSGGGSNGTVSGGGGNGGSGNIGCGGGGAGAQDGGSGRIGGRGGDGIVLITTF